ncbi:gliding motility-associated lipoprotein GldH [Parapedobacter composti]|uniref:Gliding motility-associated lipoprotein GldH n=1 Tax=Parapedobacter composti TaxID=623281 RepID=A0A1I1IFY2_9SPHI|nr:gliding motility lipoprotein GldH [Parapedobacter composti]SFC34891.1 gliding motility-associated lipoprotein GldH [Parapedobacter composti]
MYRFSAAFLGAIFLTVSCTDSALLDQYLAIPGNAWDYHEKPEIVARITDTVQPYHIYLNFRHTPDYKYANVYVLLHQTLPDGRDTTERIELPLALSDGRWLGKGGGSVYTHQVLIKEGVRFPDTGTYVFTLEQHMRENPLREVTHVGMRIEPTE